MVNKWKRCGAWKTQDFVAFDIVQKCKFSLKDKNDNHRGEVFSIKTVDMILLWLGKVLIRVQSRLKASDFYPRMQVVQVVPVHTGTCSRYTRSNPIDNLGRVPYFHSTECNYIY